ncbi:hypothetical protein [Actinoplanes sp. CA-252034]|uniref:hypothetical protein n=1 Tax=Actinoplanes sp. CA-252034 TaxID=3239906 RepID=UPI003D95363F
MRRTARRIATGVLATATTVAVAVTAGGVTPAFAGWSGGIGTIGGRWYADGAGSFWWDDYGEHLTINDNKADGAGVAVRIYGSSLKTYTFSGGAGKSGSFNLSYAEGTALDFYVCISDNGTIQEDTCNYWPGQA